VELRHLRYFVAVAEMKHFGRAAERLHMAQPALSQSVRQLESELGTALFTRTTRQVALTPAGEFFHLEAARVLAAVEESVRGVRRIAGGTSGLVRIGFTGTAGFTQLPRIARILKRDLPELAMEIHADLLTPAQSSRLLDGSLDIGVLRPPAAEGLALRTIEVEPLVLALPVDHRLAAEPVVTLEDLRTEGFVLYADSHSAVNAAVRRSCTQAGFTPRLAHEAPGTAALLALVAAGLGVSLVPRSVRAVPLAGVEFRDVAGTTTIEAACAWNAADPSPQVLAVLAALDAAGLFDDPSTEPPVASPELSEV
jgi:DNA-binding transcriptional LysR family regulator